MELSCLLEKMEMTMGPHIHWICSSNRVLGQTRKHISRFITGGWTEALVWPFVWPNEVPGDQSLLGIPVHQTLKFPGPRLAGENTLLWKTGPHRVAAELEPHPRLIRF